MIDSPLLPASPYTKVDLRAPWHQEENMRIQRDVGSIWIAAVVLLALSCGESDAPTSDGNLSRTPSGPKEVTVRVGETVVVNNVEITFTRVLEDSRCPV